MGPLAAGANPRGRLELAALCGDDGARVALGPDRVLVKGGELCCCGSLDSEHGLGDGHSPVHACDYHGVPCDCVLEDREELRPHIWPDKATLRRWLPSLAGFGANVMVRAEVAAGREVLPFVLDQPCGEAAEDALESAESWLACPCHSHRAKWQAAFHEAARLEAGWAPDPVGPLEGTILWCARLAGSSPVHEGVKHALVAWALGVS